MIQLIHGDCVKEIQKIPDGKISLCLVDLPYGCLNRSNPHAKWDNEIDMGKMWPEIWRVLTPNGACVLFGQGMFTAKVMMSQPKYWRYNLIWDKCGKTGFLNANRMPLRQHEDIMVFYRQQPVYNPQMTKFEPHQRNHSKGNMARRSNNRCYGNFVDTPTIISDEKFPTSIISIPKKHKNGEWHHPTEKHVQLLEYLINTYSNRGGVILDFTMGSGSCGVAAVNTGRDFIGIELTEEYFEIAKKRIHDAEIDKMQILDL